MTKDPRDPNRWTNREIEPDTEGYLAAQAAHAEADSALDIAITPEEVKPTDSRSRAFIERGLEPAAQLEAIPPETLVAVVRQAVESALDLDVLAASRERERLERDQVQRTLDEVNETLRGASGLR